MARNSLSSLMIIKNASHLHTRVLISYINTFPAIQTQAISAKFTLVVSRICNFFPPLFTNSNGAKCTLVADCQLIRTFLLFWFVSTHVCGAKLTIITGKVMLIKKIRSRHKYIRSHHTFKVSLITNHSLSPLKVSLITNHSLSPRTVCPITNQSSLSPQINSLSPQINSLSPQINSLSSSVNALSYSNSHSSLATGQVHIHHWQLAKFTLISGVHGVATVSRID